MNRKPLISAKSPIGKELEKGKEYFWCRCGRSGNQPFCDGSHKGTGIEPLGFEAREDGEAWLCRCKATGDAPYCDGTHKSLSDLEVGDPVPKREKESAPDAEATPEEPHVARIHELARHGLKGKHGEMGAMGVPGRDLPRWDDIQVLTAQMARKPLPDDAAVDTRLVIGPRATMPASSYIVIINGPSPCSSTGSRPANTPSFSKPTSRWVPSQNGLFFDAPQRHNATSSDLVNR